MYILKLQEIRHTSLQASLNKQAHNNKKYYRKGGNKHPGSLLEISKTLKAFFISQQQMKLYCRLSKIMGSKSKKVFPKTRYQMIILFFHPFLALH